MSTRIEIYIELSHTHTSVLVFSLVYIVYNMTPIITFACSYQLVNLFTILFWQNMGYWTYHSQLAFGTFQSFFKYRILIYLGVLVNIHYSKNVKLDWFLIIFSYLHSMCLMFHGTSTSFPYSCIKCSHFLLSNIICFDASRYVSETHSFRG